MFMLCLRAKMYGLIYKSALFKTVKNYNKITVTSFSNSHNVNNDFETVFSLPAVGYIALMNRLKVYHFIGSSFVVPSCFVMEMLNIVPENVGLTASYIGITGAAVLSLATWPFRNVIGHLYISKDNKQIKIASLDFWGKRKDRIIATEDWIPLLEIKPKFRDAFYLTPKLADGTEYKLMIKFGKVLNSKKIGQILE